jgi:hypothetical protein
MTPQAWVGAIVLYHERDTGGERAAIVTQVLGGASVQLTVFPPLRNPYPTTTGVQHGTHAGGWSWPVVADTPAEVSHANR